MLVLYLLIANLPGLAAAAWASRSPQRGTKLACAWGALEAVALLLLGSGWIEVDGLAALNRVALLGIAAVWLGAALAGAPYYLALYQRGERSNAELSKILLLTQLFMTALSVAGASRDLAIAWVALEVTTMTGAFLVAQGDRAHALEAAWKFAVLCFGGVGFCLVGIGLVGAAALGTGIELSTNLDSLTAVAGRMNPLLTQMGFAALIAGFGTKAGLVPMHWWLPDAHSQSPTPVALMSGGLVATSLIILVEAKAALAPVLGADAFQPAFIAFGLIGLTLSALSMIGQQDLKRLLAYSTIEHIGLMTLAVGIGTPLAYAAFVIHAVGHALAKSAAFLAAGGLEEAVGSRQIAQLTGSLARGSLNAVSLLWAGAALLGFPAGLLFVSEALLILAAAQADMTLLALVITLLLALAFAAFLERIATTSLGAKSHHEPHGHRLAQPYSLAPLALLSAGAYLLIARPEWALNLVRLASIDLTGAAPW